VTDPRVDRQAVIEASYVNIPCIALCDTDSPLDFVDVAIPCNNRTTESISMIYWMLSREVLILRGKIPNNEDWNVFVDLFYYKKIEEEKDEDGDKDEEFEALVGKEDEKGTKWDETAQQVGAEGEIWE
jgi:small subunit ribosomal protein SAe